MKKLFATTLLSAAVAFTAQAQNVTGTIHANQGKQKINKEIYGQFAEHLGSCIYGGLWVGPDSKIPNTQGYRNDVLQALKDLKVPVLRWPGGCFADEYHWMDGIGPRENRPKMQNNNWGGTIEDNSFGTHEFLNLCEMLGCEPYISGNVGSGTVEELAKWVEYMTSDGDTPMAKLRRQNGRDKAWKVKYLGVGNESWGCGGNMRPEYYSDLFRRYSVYCRNYDDAGRYSHAGFHLAMMCATAVTIPIVIFRDTLGILFTDNVEVCQLVSALVLPFVIYQVGDCLQCAYSNGLRGLSVVKPLVPVAFFAYFVVSLPIGYLLGLPLGLGLERVWSAFPAGLTTAGICYIYFFRRNQKRMVQLSE